LNVSARVFCRCCHVRPSRSGVACEANRMGNGMRGFIFAALVARLVPALVLAVALFLIAALRLVTALLLRVAAAIVALLGVAAAVVATVPAVPTATLVPIATVGDGVAALAIGRVPAALRVAAPAVPSIATVPTIAAVPSVPETTIAAVAAIPETTIATVAAVATIATVAAAVASIETGAVLAGLLEATHSIGVLRHEDIFIADSATYTGSTAHHFVVDGKRAGPYCNEGQSCSETHIHAAYLCVSVFYLSKVSVRLLAKRLEQTLL